MRRLIIGSFAALAAFPLSAQAPARVTTLTLPEAIDLAKRNNPQYISSLNNQRRSSIQVRQAYTNFLPTASSNLGFQWREGKPVIVEGVVVSNPPDALSSNYGISVSVGYSLQSLLGPKQAKASVNAASAGVTSADHELRAQITRQYLIVLQAGRTAALQDSLVASARTQLELSRARESAGSGTLLETKQSEVRVGQAELAAVNGHNSAERALIQLFQLIGVPPQEGVRLTTELPLAEPTFKLDDLVADAKTRNASLNQSRANQRSAEITKSATRSGYIPTLGFSTGFGGNTSNAPGIETYPWNFERNAMSFQVGLSLPLWSYNREANAQQASIALNDRQQDVRRTELQVQADVTTNYKQLLIDWRTIALQAAIAENARLALQIAQERYRAGAAAYIDVSLALDAYQREENNRVNSIFAFHQTFAALELAVGRPLR